MKAAIHQISWFVAMALTIAITSPIASAQSLDVFWTNYFANNTAFGFPGATVRITNPGVQAGNKGTFTHPGPGSLCAMVYVFAADQQLAACCGCLITPNGLQTADVRTQLTFNPLTGVVPNNGVIQIMSYAPNSTSSPTAVFKDNSPFCDPTTNATDTPDLRAWATHVQSCVTPESKRGGQPVGTSCAITETQFLPAPDGVSECPTLEDDCNFAVTQGSGQGICDCGAFEK
jgi:hypothetical protein